VKSLLGLPEFHYLFLDEVQDLPPAITYMISLLFNNGVYYSGDTAQAIQKGVSFKFQDIVMMYRPEFESRRIPLEAPLKYKLTVNFRSHNQILNLANNIVSII
jgi:superfamily I DNA/RNA helicase